MCSQPNSNPSSRNSDLERIGPALLGGSVTSGVKNPLFQSFPSRLAASRKRANLNRNQLARAAAVSAQTPANLEAAVNLPRLDTVERFAAALGIPPVWLAYGYDGGLRFRQRVPRSPVPLDPPEPTPGSRMPDNLHASFAERLRAAREARQLSMGQLAAAAHLSQQAVSRLEAGAVVPFLDTCEALAVALDVAPGWLAFGIGEDFTATD